MTSQEAKKRPQSALLRNAAQVVHMPEGLQRFLEANSVIKDLILTVMLLNIKFIQHQFNKTNC